MNDYRSKPGYTIRRTFFQYCQQWVEERVCNKCLACIPPDSAHCIHCEQAKLKFEAAKKAMHERFEAVRRRKAEEEGV